MRTPDYWIAFQVKDGELQVSGPFDYKTALFRMPDRISQPFVAENAADARKRALHFL